MDSEKAGASGFDREKFFVDVTNAVDDLSVDGFNALEKHMIKLLNLSTEEELAQLGEAVDAVFLKVQTEAGKNLDRWEKYCENHCFYIPETSATNEVEAELAMASEADPADAAKETELDEELDLLRSRILSVQGEASKLDRDRQTLETWLSCKRAQVDAVTHSSRLLGARTLSTIHEISRAAARLQKTAEMEPFGMPSTDADTKIKAAFAKLVDEFF